MLNKTNKILVLFILIAVSSCTNNTYYVPSENIADATVSFSNLSDEQADIYIISNDKRFLINENLIEKKKPQDKSKFKTNILSKDKVTFEYVYNWIMSERTEITTTYSSINTPSRVDLRKVNMANSCSRIISFSPEANKHYEVYFGLVGDKCIIRASEAILMPDSTKKLISLPTIKTEQT